MPLSHRWHPELKEWVKKTPAQIKQERLDRQAARRKKIEEKAQRKNQKEEKEKADQEAKAKESQENAGAKDGQKKKGPEDDVNGDQGIKEPEKEPIKIKRSAEPDLDENPVLEKEPSGFKHLRRRRLEYIKS